MLDTYFDAFMVAPAKAKGEQTDPNWTIKGAASSSASNGTHAANGVEVQKEPQAPVV